MKRKKLAKGISIAAALCMTVGSVSAGSIPEAHAAETVYAAENLIAWYPLSDDTKDASGNGYDAAVMEGASGVAFRNESLVLEGGAKYNNNYVKLPDGMFDGQDTLTLSMWINNNHTQMNTSAFSINGTSMSGTSPEFYFLLNPCNPDGYYKAVFTDPWTDDNPTPWGSEAGITNGGVFDGSSVITSDRMDQWMYYTVTIDTSPLSEGGQGSITAYLNGEYLGTDAIFFRDVTSFGEGLQGYIGASLYPDSTFAGSFRDVRIYDKSMSADEVGELYDEALDIQNVKEMIAGIDLEDGDTIYDPELNLPTDSETCTVVWSSSDPEVIGTDGTVQFGGEPREVTLTAEITSGSYTETVSYTLNVPDAEEAAAGAYRAQLLIPRYISEDLQSEVDGQPITWSCSEEGLVSSDGTVTRPQDEDRTVTLTASFGNSRIEKEVTIMSEGGQILSYVIQGGNLYTGEGDLLAASDSRQSDALFLAAKTDDEDTYEELNKGKAVLYVRWTGANDNQNELPDNQMGSPVLFREADGTIGAAASGNNNRNGIYVWDTEENMAFCSERFLVLAESGTRVCDPWVIYDTMTEAYKVFWEDGEGHSYVSILEDLRNGTTPEQTVEASYEKPEVTGTIPENAVESETSVFLASASEYNAITKKYATVYNTGVEEIEVSAKEGEEVVMPETVTAQYSDGSTKNLGVIWDEEDLAQLEDAGEGTYEITGEVQQDAYAYPFIEERADPYLFYNEDDGYYYSTGSYYEANMTAPNNSQSYRKVDIRRSKTIEGLKTAEEHYILESKPGDRWGGFFWAPEFHKINGKWWCLVGAHDFGPQGIPENIDFNIDTWCSNSILIPYEGTQEQMDAGGMLDADQWGEPVILENVPAYDVSYWEDEETGQGYYIIPWILIAKAEMGDGVVPQVDGQQVQLKVSEWPWEYGKFEGSITAQNPEGIDQPVVEGPFLFDYGDKVYMSYSGGTVDKFYTLGLMMADKGSDLLNPANWTNVNYPLLSSYDTYEGQIGGAPHVGGGHNSIVRDEYGNLTLVYHARPYPDPHQGQAGAGGLFDPCRNTAVKGINVAADGTLIFNMTAEEELDPQYRTITAVVRIEGDTAKPVLEGISIVSGPDKTDYVQGEELDLKGLAVEAQYSDGSSVALEEGEDGYTVTGYDPQATGEQTITVSYQEYTATFTVNVAEKEEPEDPDHPGQPVLEGISIVSGPDKTGYVQGEELDLKGLAVEAQYSDGSSVALEEGEDGYTVTGYDPQATGEQTITVSYQEYTATFTVTVTEKEEPEDPDHPGQPENPGDPGQTEDPADPGQTEDPADPGQTEDPAKPGQTEDPADPGQTTDPGTPGSSAEPGGSSQTQGGSAVQTGDTANMAPAVLTAGLAAAAAAAVIGLRRRYR